jgi:hypothetical protein
MLRRRTDMAICYLGRTGISVLELYSRAGNQRDRHLMMCSGAAAGLALASSDEVIAISLIDRVMSVIVFHEKAGRSQVDSFWFLLVMLFLPSRVATVATLPSALLDEQFIRSVQVGCSRVLHCKIHVLLGPQETFRM